MTFKADKLHIRKDGTVTIDLTSPQESGLGIIIGKMYYNTQISELLGDMCSGYPHNGGSHTLRLCGNYEDVIVGIELIRDNTPVYPHMAVTAAKMDLTMLCTQIRTLVESKK
mgnify:FL=1